jgi:hypothetical protein
MGHWGLLSPFLFNIILESLKTAIKVNEIGKKFKLSLFVDYVILY